jgi:aminoglycoside phosphotransferase (APT) family kinase protein
MEKRLAEVLGGPLDAEPRQLSSGASRETWVFAKDGVEYVAQLRRHSKAGVDEADLLPRIQNAPVPQVVASGKDDEILGREYTIARRLPGTADPRAILDDNGDDLLADMARVLADIHKTEPPPGLRERGDALQAERERYERLGQPHPVFEAAFEELEKTQPDSSRATLVHGDYRIGNLLVDDHKVSGVLDWELAHVGDPVADLGWLCVVAWRFGRPDRPAAGLGSRDTLLAAYEEASGIAVDPKELRWWEIFGNLSWGIICIQQAFFHLNGEIESLEHAVIGRRAAEVEWDLLELLGDVEGTIPDAIHDRPTATELLEAARGALANDVLPQVDGRAAFQVRVAMRALGMVMREIGHPGLPPGAGIREHTKAKLEVANPRYLERS